MGGWPCDLADTELLLLRVAPGALVLFLNFLFEMFQQSRFRFGREGKEGWLGGVLLLPRGFLQAAALFTQGIGCSCSVPSKALF